MDVSEKKNESVLNNIKYDLKQNIICETFPPLKYNAFNTLSITLWRNKLEHADLTLFNEENIREKMRCFAKEILEMVSNLSSIPVLFKPQLKEMVNLVGKEIEYFFMDHVKMYFKSLNRYKIFWDNTCWTDQSTINKVKTAEQIIDNAAVSPIEMYILACNYCLEEKIDFFLKLFPEHFINIFEDNEKLHLCFFWTFFKRGEIERFSKYSEGKETFTYILTWAISRNMEAAVQYIWENFADITVKTEVLDEIYYFEDFNPNIALYILRNFNENFNNKVSGEIYCSGLSKLHSISRWCNIISLKKYLSELSSETYDVTEAFKVALFCWHEKIFDVHQFSALWNEICIKFEHSLQEQFIDVCMDAFLKYEHSKDDIHFVKLLLGMCSKENKRRFIHNPDITECVAHLIIENGTDHFDNLFNEFFESEKETKLFKRIIFKDLSHYICIELIAFEDYESLNEFLIKFSPAKEISKFKNEYYMYDELTMNKISNKSTFIKNDQLTRVNNFLNWRFEGNDEKINQFKAKVYDLESSEFSETRLNFFMEFQHLINEYKWKLVEKYWNWIFFATEEKLVAIEEKFARIKKIFSVLFRNTGFYLGIIKYCTLFRMIISLCFKKYKFDDIVHVANRENDVAVLVEEYLEFDNYLELNDLSGGSFYLKERNDEYTPRFMFSHSCSLMFELITGDHTICKAKFFFKWFSTSVKLAKLFKKGFLNFVANKNDGYKFLKKGEKEKLIMMVRQYLIKMLKNVLNQRNISFREILKVNKINEDKYENKKYKEGEKRKREDAPFKCSKKIKIAN